MIDIHAGILDIYKNLKNNNFRTLGMPDTPMWEEPLIGIASGDDAYFDFFKTHIGPFYLTPKEVFKCKYACDVNAGDLRVVSMAFPQTTPTKIGQRGATVFPCDNWVVTRGEWEPLMKEFSGNLERLLESQGIRCVSIDLLPEFHREISDTLGLASVWSHRHTAFVAGLGTFGLSDGLITEKGMAVRLTSMIVEIPFEITERPYEGPYDWCLFKKDGSCGACIKRCPAGAISENGHNKKICDEYEDISISKYWPGHIEKGNYIFGCGLCQAGVPCQDRKP